MSCDNHPGAMEFAKGGTIILTKNDLFKIRNGEVLQFSFHGLQFGHKTITFLVSNRKNISKQTDELTKSVMLESEVCPIVIDEDEMKILKEGENMITSVLPSVPKFNIVVCTSEQWNKRVKVLNKDGNK